MFHKLIQLLKRLLPRSVKQKIKDTLGVGTANPGLYTRIDTEADKINIAINCGGGIGDFIVYKAIFDQLLAKGDCCIYVFTLSYANANLILKDYNNLFVYYPFYSITDTAFDVHLHIDHWIEIQAYHASKIKKISPELFDVITTIELHNRSYHTTGNYFLVQRNSIIFRAKALGLNRWTSLSYGTVFDMKSMRSGIACDAGRALFLRQNDLENTDYITVQYGADKDMGGTRQVKVWPLHRYSEFIKLFKKKYKHIKVVQIAAGTEPEICGADVFIKGADLEDVKIILKNAVAHISGEGGMAHLATQLETRCVVLFGPTPVHYYGYPGNANIVSPVCKECMEATEDWAVSCVRKLDNPVCMEAITGEMVLEGIELILEGGRSAQCIKI